MGFYQRVAHPLGLVPTGKAMSPMSLRCESLEPPMYTARIALEDTELAKVSQEVTKRFYNLSAVGEGGQCPDRVPGCVKTHTSGKCRKHNSLTWHPSVCPQHYQFSRRAISPRRFYARGGRWSFHTAWVRLGRGGMSALSPFSPNFGHWSAPPTRQISAMKRLMHRRIRQLIRSLRWRAAETVREWSDRSLSPSCC